MTVDWSLYVGYITVVILFMATPGPSHLLMLSQSLKFGFEKARFVAIGDLTANALQMTLASYGLASAIRQSPNLFMVIKWLGVTYLIYLGWKMTRKVGMKMDKEVGQNGFFLRGFIASSTNPKAIVFFASLFPQFIDIAHPIAPQLALLGVSYIVIDAAFLCLYGTLAHWTASKYQHKMGIVNRVAGGLLILAAVLLALKSL